MKHYQINFEYSDKYTNGGWRTQSCTLYADGPREAVNKTIELYGLGVDCQYHVTEVIDLDKEAARKYKEEIKK